MKADHPVDTRQRGPQVGKEQETSETWTASEAVKKVQQMAAEVD